MKTTKKSKKKNRTLVLIILLAVVALLVCGYFVAKNIKEKREAEEERKAEEEAEAQSVMLTNHTLDDVKNIYYSYDGESVEIELENGIYYIKNDHEFPLDQSAAKIIANQFAAIKSKRLLEETRTNFSVYGLDSPDYIIRITYADGTEFNFAAGDYNKNVDAYYVNIFDTYAVYLFDPLYISTLEFDMSNLFYTTDEITVKSDEVRKLDISYSANALQETSCGYNYSVSDSKWTKLINGTELEDTDKDAEYIIDQILDLPFDSYAGYAVDTDEELEKYGLLSPYASFKMTYNESVSAEDGTTADVEKSISIDFGVLDGKVYFKLDSSDIVYNIAVDSIDGIVTANVGAEND